MPFPPGPSDFKAYFTREFKYGISPDTVMDSDIGRALSEASITFNSGLWISTSEQNTAYLYVAAHFLVLNIQEAGGLSQVNKGAGVLSKGGGTIESKGAESLSVGYAVPDFVRKSPILSQFMRTDFGQKYIQMVSGRLVGNVAILGGGGALVGGFSAARVAPLAIATAQLPAGVQAAPYSFVLAASGGIAPLTWSVTSGTLPPGLSLDANTGVVSGFPSAAMSAYFTIGVVDRVGATSAMNYELVVS